MFREDFHGEEGVFRLRVRDVRDFLLSFEHDGEIRVEYRPGRRTVHGRSLPYEFKSIEKLRYDFERDVENALRQG